MDWKIFLLNKYLGQTILPKIFPLQGWCRGNFFPSSISDPILTNIGQIPQLHQNIGGGASLTQWIQNMIFTIRAELLSLLSTARSMSRWIWESDKKKSIEGILVPKKKILDKHWLSAEAEDVETAGPLIMWDCEMQNWR